MRCPHCAVVVNPDFVPYYFSQNEEGYWCIYHMVCPNPDCKKFIIRMGTEAVNIYSNKHITNIKGTSLLYPISIARNFMGQEVVDEQYWNDYREACLILYLSPKASAALSRRCLQNILRAKAGVKAGNLSDEIQQVLKSGELPSLLYESIDAVRNIGNFAAHPTKDTSTGEIIEVEPEEAEWLLNVLELAMDFYFVQPAKMEERRKALNEKLEALGKPPMK